MTKIVVIISIKCRKTQIVDYNIICNIIYNSTSTDKIAPVQIMIIIIYYGLLLILLSRRQQSSNLSDYPIVYTPIIQKLVSTAAGIIPYYKAFGLQKLVINKNLKNAPTGRRVIRLCTRRVPPAAHV